MRHFPTSEVKKIHTAEVTAKVTQGHQRMRHLIGHYEFLLVSHYSYKPYLYIYRFWDIIAYFRQ